MATPKKISDLPVGTLSDTDSFPILDDGVTKRVTAAALAAYIDAQPADADLDAIAALTTTAYGRALLTLADVAALRAALGTGYTADLSASYLALAGGSTITIPADTTGLRLNQLNPNTAADAFVVEDTSANQRRLMQFEHHGTDIGIDLKNYDGAGNAVVIHNYSALGAGITIDNTDVKAAISVNGTTSPTNNPDGPAAASTGPLIEFSVAGSRFMYLGANKTWVLPTTSAFSILNNAGGGGLVVTNTANTRVADLDKTGTGAGEAVRISNAGTGPMLLARAGSTTKFQVTAGGAIDVLNGATVTQTAGSGTPEGAVTAPVGSTYQRTDGGAGTSFYVKESGTGNSGWVAK